MREDFLHFIWKYRKFQLTGLVTSENEVVTILDVGSHNHLAGPDFFNAKIDIDGQLWAGTVEIHIKSSDWYAHNHERDSNYNNVILHVVWEDDATVFRSDKTEIPTLELKNYISKNLLEAVQKLFDKKGVHFINCEKDIAEIDGFVFQNWLERLYFERLEQKSVLIDELLEKSQNDWEKVVFTLLLKNFGSKINSESFLSLSRTLDFSVIRKTQNHVLQLESLLFGLLGLLENDSSDQYLISLKREYDYLKHKFNLSSKGVRRPDFFKLRPSNFPTIRLSQFANLYGVHQNVFSKIIEASTSKEIYAIFEISASTYWSNHFTFGKESKKSIKKLTKNFVDLIIINTILPIKFSYAKHLGRDISEELIRMISMTNKEKNTVISSFEKIGARALNAKDSQAFIQLYTQYCTKNKCLQCTVGSSLLQRN
ncbi:MAG: DUF2851 family protein [Flavobacteriaceae bacterium]